jgi:hypothetical protein
MVSLKKIVSMESDQPMAEWTVLTCPSCGSRMKARAATVGSVRILCPVCRGLVSEVEVLPPIRQEAPSPEFGGSIPMKGGVKSVVVDSVSAPGPGKSDLPKRDDGEFAGGVADVGGGDEADGAEFFNRLHRTDEFAGPVRVKVKKRRRGGSGGGLADWDEASEGTAGGELAADTWEHASALPEDAIEVREKDLITGTTERNGVVVHRVKRSRRQREASAAQMFFRRLTAHTKVVAGLLCAVIVGGAAYYGWKTLSQRWKAVTYEEAGGTEFESDRTYLTLQDISGAEDAVRAFLASDSVERMLEHVRLPARVKPLMERWYRNRPLQPMTAGEVTNQNKLRSGELYLITLEMTVNEPDPLSPGETFPQSRYFAVEEIRDSLGSSRYKVDWETSVGYQEMPLEEFREEMVKRPVPFRVRLKESDYYLHGFSDPREWRCVELYYPGRDEFHLYGYIRLGTGKADRLLALVDGGISSAAVLTLRYPDDAVSRDQVVVEDLLLPSWFYTEDVADGEATGGNR